MGLCTDLMLADHVLAPMKHGGGALGVMTRIAASDPLMCDIALTNRDATMDAMAQEHDHLRTLIAAADGDAMKPLPGDACGASMMTS